MDLVLLIEDVKPSAWVDARVASLVGRSRDAHNLVVSAVQE